MRNTKACSGWLAVAGLLVQCLLSGAAHAQGAQPVGAAGQAFQLNGPEPVSYGFVASQPGVIHVDVQSVGAPIRVAIVGATSSEQVGSGRIGLNYTLTPADLQRSVLWYVRISLQNPPPRAGQVLAQGSLSIQHPPGDGASAQRQLAALRDRHSADAQQFLARLAADVQSKQQLRNVELAKQHDAMRAAAEARLPPAIRQGRLSTRALAPQIAGRPALSGGAAVAVSPSPALQSLQSPPPATPAPPPAITGMSDSQGLPRQLIVINGSGFGAQVGGGGVEFLINQGWKSYGTVQSWSDTVIAVYVPDAAGVFDFAGTVTVLRADGKRSNAFPFGFVAERETRYITTAHAVHLNDYVIAAPGKAQFASIDHGPETTGNIVLGFFYGSKGDDVFFSTSRLSNPWRIDWVQVYNEDTGATGSAGSWDVGDRVGTQIPFLTVHWYYDAFAYIVYAFQEQITGPRGTADGIIVTAPPAPTGVIAAQ